VKRSQVAPLRDLLEQIDTVAEMIEGVDLSAYRRDVRLRRATERCVEIISEASRHLPEELTAFHPDQPWSEIAAIGTCCATNIRGWMMLSCGR